MISNKIMKVYENKDAIVYRAMCDCGSSNCDLTLDIEKAPDLDMVFLTLYKTLSWLSYGYSYSTFSSFRKVFWRIRSAFKILFWGEIKVEGDFVMREEQMDTFIKALQEAKETLKGEVS